MSNQILFLCSILWQDTGVVRAPVIPDSPVRVPELPVPQISVQPSAPGKVVQDSKVMYPMDLHFGLRRNVVGKPLRPHFFCCLRQLSYVVRYIPPWTGCFSISRLPSPICSLFPFVQLDKDMIWGEGFCTWKQCLCWNTWPFHQNHNIPSAKQPLTASPKEWSYGWLLCLLECIVVHNTLPCGIPPLFNLT